MTPALQFVDAIEAASIPQLLATLFFVGVVASAYLFAVLLAFTMWRRLVARLQSVVDQVVGGKA